MLLFTKGCCVGPSLLANNPSLIWSGFELKGHEACYDCDDRGWPGVGIVSVTEYVGVAAPAGSYKATFQVLDAPPSNCNEMSDGDLSCTTTVGGYGWMPGDPEACSADRTVSVTFTLPASGDLTVPVVIPPPAP